MHSQKSNKAQRNVAWKIASKVPGIEELNKNVIGKMGSRNKENMRTQFCHKILTRTIVEEK